jgi:Tol biopolymer transport system component
MKPILVCAGISTLVCLAFAARAGQESAPALTGPYLGQKPPGLVPVVFAPGVVSTSENELNAAFSPDGSEFYFTTKRRGRNTLMSVKFANHRWTGRAVAEFSGDYGDVDPFVSSDGEKLYFSSKRPLSGSGKAKDSDIWYVERTPLDEWRGPTNLRVLNDQGADDYYTSISSDGMLYFSRFEAGGRGGDLFRSQLSGGRYGEPELLDSPINSEYSEHDPFIAPDGSYLIFTSNRPGGFGRNDLYISFRNSADKWSDPRNMGDEINSSGYDFCPMLSPDGEYLFFTRSVDGSGDIYWVDAAVIEALGPDIGE